MSNLRESFEVRFKTELEALKANDTNEKPTNWQLSPQAVRTFILGSSTPLSLDGQKVTISKKFFGDNALVERCIITLASNRALLLIGEPGTAKSYLSELLSAAICNNSRNTIQGSIGLTEDMIKYSWNYALLIAKGPIPQALVPAPLYTGMQQGIITRFEEITRAPLEIQDTLISVLSDKILSIPELRDNPFLEAQQGFNVIATANTRDRGINEMSSALKRRFNFETVKPLNNIQLESEVITQECQNLLKDLPSSVINDKLINFLVLSFNELRQGRAGNITFESPSTVLSTAEAVNIYHQTAVDAYYYHNNKPEVKTLVQNIITAVCKDNTRDLDVLKNYVAATNKLHKDDKYFKELKKVISAY